MVTVGWGVFVRVAVGDVGVGVTVGVWVPDVVDVGVIVGVWVSDVVDVGVIVGVWVSDVVDVGVIVGVWVTNVDVGVAVFVKVGVSTCPGTISLSV
jgi:hypothetical protein